MSLLRPRFHAQIGIQGSSLLKTVQYDVNSWTLDVSLKSGNRYRYRGVAPSTFAQLVTSSSAGKVFNKLKNAYGVTSRKLPKR
jgi:hypothetical protein